MANLEKAMEMATFLEEAMKMATLDLIEEGWSKEQIIKAFETEAFEQRVLEYNKLFDGLANA